MSDTEQRQAAIKRLEAKRGFKVHLVVYLLVNALLIGIWFANGMGPFWPIWSIGGWGIGLVAHRLSLQSNKPISEDEIRREMEKGS